MEPEVSARPNDAEALAAAAAATTASQSSLPAEPSLAASSAAPSEVDDREHARGSNESFESLQSAASDEDDDDDDDDDDDEDEDDEDGEADERSGGADKVAYLGAKASSASNAALGLEAANRAFRDDPLLDRRIIEGMLDDKEGFLDDMHGEGFSREAVVRRAAELGLSEALIRQVKGVAADLAGERPGKRPTPSSLGARTCLQCDRVFFSSGPGNRLCTRCRGGDAGLAQL